MDAGIYPAFGPDDQVVSYGFKWLQMVSVERLGFSGLLFPARRGLIDFLEII
jgi:hypothetical protein